MSIRLMTLVWDLPLSTFEKLVMLALADCASDEGECWPSIATLCRKTGAGERTIQRSINSLIEVGLLKRILVTGKSSRYWLDPRHSGTPARQTPPPETTQTPATVAPHPRHSGTLTVIEPLEPSNDKAVGTALTPETIVEGWNELAGSCGLPKVVKLTTARKRAVQCRLRDYPDLADWQKAFACIHGAGWMHGDNDRSWRADFDFLLQPKSFTRLVEGTYARTQ